MKSEPVDFGELCSTRYWRQDRRRGRLLLIRHRRRHNHSAC